MLSSFNNQSLGRSFKGLFLRDHFMVQRYLRERERILLEKANFSLPYQNTSFSMQVGKVEMDAKSPNLTFIFYLIQPSLWKSCYTVFGVSYFQTGTKFLFALRKEKMFFQWPMFTEKKGPCNILDKEVQEVYVWIERGWEK